jgi:DNA-3-methyladenine glycosylase II
MRHFSIGIRGPFSLDAARELQCGFLRGSRTCSADRDSVRMAFPRDGSFDVVGDELAHRGARLEGTVVGARDGVPIGRQLARALALDHDGAGFARVLDADPALRALAAERPGFRPVVAYSPYVMAGWAVLSQRLRMEQAAAIQVRIARAAGDTVELGGEALASFPRPQTLLALDGFPGVAEEKWTRLQGIARAALDGELEAEALCARSYAESRARLMSLRGVGPWTADAILVRGCGLVDELPLSEPTLHAGVALAYGLERVPTHDEVIAIAERWKPFRTWVSVLVVSSYYRLRPRSSTTAALRAFARPSAGRAASRSA